MRIPRSPRIALLLGGFGLAGCSGEAACPEGSSRRADGLCYLDDADDADDAHGTDDTGEGSTAWLAVPAGCEAPSDLEADPVQMVAELRYVQGNPEDGSKLTELVDVRYDANSSRVYGVGQGGLYAWDVSDPAAPRELINWPEPDSGGGGGGGPPESRRYHRSAQQDSVLYLSSRDSGLFLMDLDRAELDDDHWAFEHAISGLAVEDGVLYASDHNARVLAYDIGGGGAGGTPTVPVALGFGAELGQGFWNIKVDGTVAYLADQSEGLVLVDLSDPGAPVTIGATTLGYGAQDVVADGDVAYLAAGSYGIAVIDISDPTRPGLIAEVDYGASVQSLALDGDLLWGVNQEGVVALDVSDPTAPVPVGTWATEQWAMAVTAGDGHAFVGDWNLMSVWEADRAARVPDADLNPSEVFVREEGDTFLMELANRGGGTLDILGASTESPLVRLEADRLTVAPGEVAQLRVTFDGGATLDEPLCIATNNPGSPLLEVALHTGDGGQNEAIGEPAPDFALTDLDGNVWRLSEQLGHPVVIAYFTTW